MGRSRRVSIQLTVGGLFLAHAAMVLAGSPAAHAAPESARAGDCAALNRDPLIIGLETETTTVQQLALKAGDIVSVRFETAAVGPFGSVTLREGAGSPRSLLVGPAGTSVDFAPARAGSLEFEFAKEGPEPASFSLSCAPANRASARSASVGGETSRRAAKLFGGTLAAVEPFAADDPTALVLDPTLAPSGNGGDADWQGNQRRPLGVALLPPSDLDVNLQWRDERERARLPFGQPVDHAPAGVDARLKYKPLPDIMVGALAQFEQPGGAVASGPVALSEQGWMAGPVAEIKLAPGLSLDARAAWGVAETAADPFGARTISTPRREVSARLAKTQSVGPWRLTPSISVHHFQEASTHAGSEQEAVDTHTSSSGRVQIGPEIAYRVDLENSAFIEPRAVIGSFWDINSLSNLSPGAVGHGDMRLKAEAGFTVGASDGAKLQAGAAVEEGAAGADNVWSGRLQLSVPIK